MITMTRTFRLSTLIVALGVLSIGVLALGQGKKNPPASRNWTLEILAPEEGAPTLVPATFAMPSTLYEVKDLDTSFWFNAYAGSDVRFQNVVYPEQFGLKQGAKVCGFPGSTCQTVGDSTPIYLPECMINFLNDFPHPTTGYNRILFRFNYPSGRTTQDQAVGEKLPVQQWRLYIEGQNLLGSCSQCSDCDRHTITGDAHGYTPEGGELPDMYIERTGPDTWEINVNTWFDNPDYSTGYPDNPDPYDTDMLRADYCVCEQVPGSNPKRPTYIKTSHTSAWTRTQMNFRMRFSRN